MVSRDIYAIVAERCPAYSSLYKPKVAKNRPTSCETCERFKNNACSLKIMTL